MSEFKNFVTLEKADIKLKHAIVYGLRGFDTLNDTLSDIWTPDVIHNQLRGVLAGIGMTRPLVELGIGIRDIVAVPVAEIRKDGFKVRSVQKGAIKALSTTSSGFARLIAKVAIGTGTRLQDIEDMLSPSQHPSNNQALSNVEDEYEQSPPRAVSNYADQPLGVLQGLHSARRYLERDLTTARDAIIAVQGDFMASGTAAGAAKAVIRHAPTILLQPVIGVSRAVGQTFKGVGNQVDRDHIKKSEDVSCAFCFSFFSLESLSCLSLRWLRHGEAFFRTAKANVRHANRSTNIIDASGYPPSQPSTAGTNRRRQVGIFLMQMFRLDIQHRCGTFRG
jgi:autophagy-related protein 2